MYYILSLITAALISVMIAINGELTSCYNFFTATVIIHLVGFLATSCLCAIRKVQIFSGKKLPILLYSGGAIGVATTMFNTIAFGQISVSAIVALGLVGQSAASLIIDQFGFFNMPRKRFSFPKLIGLIFTVAGVSYMLIGTKFALVPVILSILAGVTNVVSRSVNAELSGKNGVLYATWYNYAVGLTVSAAILTVMLNTGHAQMQMFISPKMWIYLGGIIGICVVSLSNFLTPKMPAFQMSLILFAGQMFTGILLDSVILHKFATGSLVGGLFVTLGLALNAWLDNKIAIRKSAC